MMSIPKLFKFAKENVTELLVALMVGFYFLYVLITAPTVGELFARMPNDPAMRLVGLRDLIAGQSWWDYTQYRLGVVGGVEIHWARVVDAPILSLMWLFGLFTSADQSQLYAALVWPMVVSVPLLWVIYRLSLVFSDAELAPPQARIAAQISLVLAALFVIDQVKFKPGNIDHHHVQVLLLFSALLGFLKRHERPRMAWLSGSVIALSLIVGFEFLVGLVLFCAIVGMFWVFQGQKEARATWQFCLGLIFTLLIVTPFSAPFSAWRGGFCDAISIDLMVPAIMAAGGLAILARVFSRPPVFQRAMALCALAFVVLLFVIWVMPTCLHNPLDDLDPFLVENWLSNTSEARSFSSVLRQQKTWAGLGYFVVAMGSIALVSRFMLRKPDARWVVLLVLLIATTLLTAYQIRSSIFLYLMSVFAVAVPLAKLWGHARPVVKLVPLYCGALMAPILWPSILEVVAPLEVSVNSPDKKRKDAEGKVLECIVADQLQSFREQPKGLVAAGVNNGANLLLLTPHRYLSAPYHRNQAGMLAQLTLEHAQSLEEIHQLLEQHEVNYLLACEDDVVDDESLWHAIAHGEISPAFLSEMPVDHDKTIMRIFKVSLSSS